jgi:hypothetical protein
MLLFQNLALNSIVSEFKFYKNDILILRWETESKLNSGLLQFNLEFFGAAVSYID